MNAKLELLKSILQKTIDDIDAGNTTSDDKTLETAIEVVSNLNKGIPKYSKRYLSDKILHCSESCFNNYLAMGLIPPGKKEYGFKELRWSIRDMKEALEYRKTH